MADWHYFNEDGDRVGPITGRQLKKLAKDGIITPGTVVETENGTTGLAKNVVGLTFAESVLKLETVLRPHNEVGLVPHDTGEIYDVETPPESSDEPSLILVSESVVENTSPSSTRRTATYWDWETLYNRSILSVLGFLCLMAVVMVTAAFMGVRWYSPDAPQQQVADAKLEQQNAGAKEEPVKLPPFKDIFEAAAKGTVDDVRYFLDRRNVKINQTDSDGNTLLHIAAEHNPDTRVAQCLITQGADVNVRNNGGWTPLDISPTDEIRVVLREAGAMPYQSPFEDIFEAASNGTARDVAHFVKNGVNVDTRGGSGRTPLHNAAHNNSDVEVLRYLVSQGADVNAKDDNNEMPLLLAVWHNPNAESVKVELMKCLVSLGADVNAGNNWGATPLLFVADFSDVEATKFLVSRNANVNAKTWDGHTPLHGAAANNSNVEVVRYLFSVRGADINARNNDGRTPFDAANTEEKRAIIRAAGGR